MKRDDRTKKTEKARETMQRIGMQLLQEKKAEIQREYGEKGMGVVGKKDLQGRDLLTLLIKANLATDIPDDQKLTDEEVIARASYLSLDVSHILICECPQRFRRSLLLDTRPLAPLPPGVSTRSASVLSYRTSSGRSY